MHNAALLQKWKQDHQQVLNNRLHCQHLERLVSKQSVKGQFYRFHRTLRHHQPGERVFFSAPSSWSTTREYASRYGRTGYCIRGCVPGAMVDAHEAVLGVCCLVVLDYDNEEEIYMCTWW
jgi:hypothetical protein